MYHFAPLPPCTYVFSAKYPPFGGGFPHSEIPGSRPRWRLPGAYRSLARLSSALGAKTSTMYP